MKKDVYEKQAERTARAFAEAHICVLWQPVRVLWFGVFDEPVGVDIYFHEVSGDFYVYLRPLPVFGNPLHDIPDAD